MPILALVKLFSNSTENNQSLGDQRISQNKLNNFQIISNNYILSNKRNYFLVFPSFVLVYFLRKIISYLVQGSKLQLAMTQNLAHVEIGLEIHY